MATVTGVFGGQNVSLDNAASEATLKAILAAIKANGGSATGASSLAGKAGVDPAKVAAANKALEELSKKAGSGAGGAGGMLSKMAGPIGIVGGVVGDLASSAVQTGKNLIDLGEKALDGKARMSDFFGAFKDLPVIGLVAGLFQQLEKMQEANLDAYRSLTQTGVDFGGSLQTVRKNALSLGMGLDEFQKVIKNNSEAFVALAGNANDGAKAFVATTKSLKESKMGAQLQALGFTFEQQAELVGSYIKTAGTGAAKTAEDQAALAESAGRYGKELDLLARLSGKSREEEEKKLAKASMQAAYQAKLAGLTKEQQEKAAKGLADAMATAGDAGVEAFQSQLLGLPPMTEKAAELTAQFPEAAAAVTGMADGVKSNTTAVEQNNINHKLMAQGLAGTQKRLKENEEVYGAISLSGGKSAGVINDMYTATLAQTKAGNTNAESIEKNMKEQEAHQKELMESEAASAAKADEAMKRIGESLMAFIQPLLQTLQPLMTDMISGFSQWLGSPSGQRGLKAFGEAMAELVKNIANYMKNLFSPEGREKIVNDIKTGLKLLMLEIKKAILPSWLFSESDYEEQKAVIMKDKEVMDDRAKAANEAIDAQARIKAVETARDADKLKTLQQTIATDKAAAEALMKKKDLTDKEKADLKDLQKKIDENTDVEARAQQLKKEGAEAQEKELADAKAKQSALDKAKATETSGDKKTRLEKERQQQDAELAEAMMWQQFADGTVGSGGSILKDFGTESPAMLHGKEAVLNEKQLTNLAKGAYDMGKGGGQDALLGSLNTLNMQVAQLIAISSGAAASQKSIVDKLTWTGNVFS